MVAQSYAYTKNCWITHLNDMLYELDLDTIFKNVYTIEILNKHHLGHTQMPSIKIYLVGMIFSLLTFN